MKIVVVLPVCYGDKQALGEIPGFLSSRPPEWNKVIKVFQRPQAARISEGRRESWKKRTAFVCVRAPASGRSCVRVCVRVFHRLL